MKASWSIALSALGVSMAAAGPVSAQAALTHEASVPHAAGVMTARWTGTPRITPRQIGAPGAAGRPQSLRCVWRVDLDIARHARLASGASLHSTVRAERAYEISRPGWCGPEKAAFAGQVATRDDALRARLHEHAASDTRALIAQADDLARSANPTG